MRDRGGLVQRLLPLTWLFMIVFAVAFVGGILIGTASEPTAHGTPAPTAAGHEGQTAAETEVVTVGKTASLPSTPPSLNPIGAGLEGVQGLEASVFAEGIPSVEALTPAPERGSYFAATGAEKGPNGVYLVKEGAKPLEVISGLKPTTGILWHDNQLYVSTMGEVLAYSDWNGSRFASRRVVLGGLPAGEMGWNDDIKAGPGGRLYLTIGSPCDHCRPTSPLSASIVSFEPDGSDLRFFATELRGNAFFEFDPKTGLMFAASNERNDVEPTIPDELLLVQEGDDFGFPACRHHYETEPSCQGITRPLATLDAHGAQDGLALVEGKWGVATGGLSSVSTEWTLGKVIQSPIEDSAGVYTAEPQQVIGGMRNPSAVIHATGEPSTLLIADYGSGEIYAISPGEGAATAAAAAPPKSSAEGGKEIVETTCSACHTLAEANATGTVGPNLDQLKPSKSLVEKQVTDGGGGMPAFKGRFSPAEIEAVAEYVSGVAGTEG